MNKIPQEIIAKAIQGGWEVFIAPNTGLIFYDQEFMFEADENAIALDKDFWIALGKSLGFGTHLKSCRWIFIECSYKETHEYCPHPEHGCTCLRTRTWRQFASRFFELIMEEKETDSFWQNLLNV